MTTKKAAEGAVVLHNADISRYGGMDDICVTQRGTKMGISSNIKTNTILHALNTHLGFHSQVLGTIPRLLQNTVG